MGCGASSIPKDDVGLVAWEAPRSAPLKQTQPGEYGLRYSKRTTDYGSKVFDNTTDQTERNRSENIARKHRFTSSSVTSVSTPFLFGSSIVSKQLASNSKHASFTGNGRNWSAVICTQPFTRTKTCVELIVLQPGEGYGGLVLGLTDPSASLSATPGYSPCTLGWAPYLGVVMRGSTPSTPPLQFHPIALEAGDVLRMERMDTIDGKEEAKASTPTSKSAAPPSQLLDSEAQIATTIVWYHNGQECARVDFHYLSYGPSRPPVPMHQQPFYPGVSLQSGCRVLFTQPHTRAESQSSSMLLADVQSALAVEERKQRDAREALERRLANERERMQRALTALVEQVRNEMEIAYQQEQAEASRQLQLKRETREREARARYETRMAERMSNRAGEDSEFELELARKSLSPADKVTTQRTIAIRRAQEEDSWESEKVTLEKELLAQKRNEDRDLKMEETRRLQLHQVQREFLVEVAKVSKEELERTLARERADADRMKMLQEKRKLETGFRQTSAPSASATKSMQVTPRPDLLLAPLPASYILSSNAVPPPFITSVMPQVWLHEYHHKDPLTGSAFEYSLRNSSNQAFIFVLNFTGSAGFDLYGPVIQKFVVFPFQEKSLSIIRQSNAQQAFQLHYTIEILMRPIEPAEEVAAVRAYEEGLREEQKLLQRSPLSVDNESALAAIVADCSAKQVVFIDQDFPPIERSLYKPFSTSTSASSAAHQTAQDRPNPFPSTVPRCIPWRRAMHFQKKCATLLSPATAPPIDPLIMSPTDTNPLPSNQGFISAVAILAEHSSLFASVFEINATSVGDSAEIEGAMAGVYKVRLNIGGKWVYITVDDYIPCFPTPFLESSTPFFHSHRKLLVQDPLVNASAGTNSQQGFVALLEKACAKAVGSYEELFNTSLVDFMSIFTGAPCQSFLLSLPAIAKSIQAGDDAFFQFMIRLAKQEQILFAEIDPSTRTVELAQTAPQEANQHPSTPTGQPSAAPQQTAEALGLLPGFGYAIMRVVQLPSEFGSEKLLQLRNPWCISSSRHEAATATDGSAAAAMSAEQSQQQARASSLAHSGAWSDNSPRWKSGIRALLSPSLSHEQDGLFWVSWDEFVSFFTTIHTAFIRSPLGFPWSEARFESTFEGSEPFLPTHFYTLDVVGEPSQLLVSLTQLTGEKQEQQQHQQGVDAADGDTPQERFHARTLRARRSRMDLGCLIVSRDASQTNRVANIWLDSKLATDAQVNQRTELQPGQYLVVPYTSGFRLLQHGSQSRPFSLAFFSDHESTIANLRPMAADTQLGLMAMTAALELTAAATQLGDASIGLKQLKLEHGLLVSYGISLDASAIEPLEVSMDFSASTNVASHRAALSHTTILQPGQCVLFHTLGPVDDEQDMNIAGQTQWR